MHTIVKKEPNLTPNPLPETLYEEYLEVNSKGIIHKLKEFEKLIKIEEILKKYILVFLELDREQYDIGFYKFVRQFNEMSDEIGKFNPNDIRNEFLKIEDFKEFINKHSSDFSGISKKIDSVEFKWTSFIKRNTNFRNTKLDEYFYEEFKKIWNLVENSVLSDLSSVDYSVNKFEEDIDSIISGIQKISIYLEQYLFLGDEAKEIKEELERFLLNPEIDSREEFISLINATFNKFNQMFENSISGLVGLPVVKLFSQSSPDIFKYTVKISDNEVLSYDSFFKSSGLLSEETGKFIYMNNFPKVGIFKGREVCDYLEIDKKYISSILKTKEKFNRIMNISLFSIIGLTFFSMFTNSLVIGIGLSLSFLILYLSLSSIFSTYVKKNESIYKDMFFISEIDVILYKLGNNIDIRNVFLGFLENFDSVFKDSGGKKWIKEFQFQKNL